MADAAPAEPVSTSAQPAQAIPHAAAYPRRRTRQIVLGSIALLGLVLYILALFSFNAESAKSPTLLVIGSTDPNRLAVLARIISADAASGEMLVRFDFAPLGTLAADELSPTKDLLVVVNSANGRQEQRYEQNEPMSSLDARLNMDGQAASYPFDQHQIELELEVSTPSAQATAPREYVPASLTLAGSLHGLRVAAVQAPETTPTYAVIDVTLSRSLFTMAFAVFGMLVMWAITAVVLFLVYSVVVWQHKVDLTMLSLSAVLLFGFYAFRNSLPGTPPIGTLSDVMAFFWAEATAALALTTLTTTWIRRSGKL